MISRWGASSTDTSKPLPSPGPKAMRRAVSVSIAVCTVCVLFLLALDFHGAGVGMAGVVCLGAAANWREGRRNPMALVIVLLTFAVMLSGPHISYTAPTRALLLAYVWFAGYGSWEIIKANRRGESLGT